MTTEINYKSNIMRRFGGEDMYDLIVIDMIGALRDDPKLEQYFSSFDTKNLVLQMKQLLDAAFVEHPSGFDIKSFVLLRYYSLIGQGFNECHFDLVMEHFREAMEDSWVESSAAHDALEMLMSLREFFTDAKHLVEFQNENNEKKSAGFSFSGEGMFRMMQLKGSKRTQNMYCNTI